jgi:hypothetical protein
MREQHVTPRGRTYARGTGGAVPNSRYIEQIEVVDLI